MPAPDLSLPASCVADQCLKVIVRWVVWCLKVWTFSNGPDVSPKTDLICAWSCFSETVSNVGNCHIFDHRPVDGRCVRRCLPLRWIAIKWCVTGVGLTRGVRLGRSWASPCS